MAFQVKTMKERNKKKLGLRVEKPVEPPPPVEKDTFITLESIDDESNVTLEIGVKFRLGLHNEDLIVLKELGAGNGGTVSKVQHVSTKQIMARKIIHVEAKKEVRKRIVRELDIMHECSSPYIVSFYGAFMNSAGDVVMCMEYMDTGSLDSISRNFGPVRVDVLGKIAEAVLGGLTYLYATHKIMHRDIKPSNVLVNSRGKIKLCDFGVSSELENSVADTFVGTGTYMAPERIQGSPYTVKSDVWSVGLTLMELAIGKFPFAMDDANGDDSAGPQGILDLLQQIVLEPAPKLPKSDAFPQILEDVVAKCLMKDPSLRPTPQELYESDAFLQAAKRTPVDLEAWALSIMDKHGRKSHLAPDALHDAGRGSGSSPSTSSAALTPTSGDIPIASLSLGPDPYPPAPYESTQHGSRPFPLRTSSAPRVPQEYAQHHQMMPPARPAPSGPLPQVPRSAHAGDGMSTGVREQRWLAGPDPGWGNGRY